MRRTVSRQSAAAIVSACVALLLATSLSQNEDGDGTSWRLVAEETFDDPLDVDTAGWTRDPQGDGSPWHVDDLDDDGAVWRTISGPAFE